MEPREFTKTPMTLYPWTPRPYTNITPFTVRDAATMLEILEKLRHWLRVELVPHVDEEIKKLVDAWEDNILEIITSVEDQLNEQNEEFTQKIVDFTEQITQQLAAQDQAVADAIDGVINNSIEVNDEMVKRMLEDAASQTRVELDSLYTSKVLFQETFQTFNTAISGLDERLDSAETQISETSNSLTETSNNLANLTADVSEFKSKIVELDIRETTPTYASQFNLEYNGVHQMVNKSPTNGMWYIPQTTTYAGSSGRPSIVVNRCGFDGMRIDTMTLQDAGHGTNTCIEVEDDQVYVWSSWARYDSNGSIASYELARIKYRSGTVNLSDPEVETFLTFTNKYTNIYVDFYNDYCVIREVDQIDGQDRYVLRKFSEFKAGTDNELGSITIDSGAHVMQGFAVFGDEKLYYITGEHDTGTSPDPATIWVYNWNDSSLDYSMNVKEVGYAGGVMPTGGKEPEGISFYVDSNSDDVVMFIGMASGNEGKKIKTVYAYSNRISKDVLNGVIYRLNSSTAPQPESIKNFLNPSSGTTIVSSNLVTVGGIGYISIKFTIDKELQHDWGNVTNTDVAYINDSRYFPLFESALVSASSGAATHGYVGESGQITIASVGTAKPIPTSTTYQLSGAYPLARV